MPSVAVAIFPGVQALDVAGPVDVFSEANKFLPRNAHYQVTLLSAEPNTLRASNGMALVADDTFEGTRRAFDLAQQFLLLAAKRDLPADAVDRLVARDIDQPRPRIGRRIGGGPALQRDRESILQRVLGEVEIADQADQRRQRPTRLGTEYFFDIGRGHAVGQSGNVIPGRPKDAAGSPTKISKTTPCKVRMPDRNTVNYKPRSA